MRVFPRIFFDVHLFDPDLLFSSIFKLDLKPTIVTDRCLGLCDLVCLWIIWIEVVFAIKVDIPCDLTVKCQGRTHPIFQSTLVQLWQDPWVAPIDNISIRVWFCPVNYWCGRISLGVCLHFNVDFKSDRCFKVH